MIDSMALHLGAWLGRQPRHLVGLSSVGFFVFGLWVIGHQWGLL